MRKIAYKLELFKEWKIYDNFHILLLEPNIIKKKWVNKLYKLELEASNDKKYKVEAIRKSAVYTKKFAKDQLLRLYYIVFWKDYTKSKNIWKPTSAIFHLQKLINTFYKKYAKKLIAVSVSLNLAQSIAHPSIKFLATNKTLKQRKRCLVKNSNKRDKK